MCLGALRGEHSLKVARSAKVPPSSKLYARSKSEHGIWWYSVIVVQNSLTLVSTPTTPHNVLLSASAYIEATTVRVQPTSNLVPGQQLEFKTRPSPHDPYPPAPLLPSLHLCRRPLQRHAVVPIMGRGTLVCRSVAASFTVVRVPGTKSGKGSTCSHRLQPFHQSP